MRAARLDCRRCDHHRDAHEHYRPGMECALCPCPKWRRWMRQPDMLTVQMASGLAAFAVIVGVLLLAHLVMR